MTFIRLKIMRMFFFLIFLTLDQKRTRQKSKVSSSNMNTPQQYNKSIPPNSANGSSHNIHANNNQYTKSMDDWLNSNNGNCNNGNNIADANRASHLDEWLNATMKDSPKTFSISSTEFLDGPTRNVINSNGLGSMGMVMPPVNLLRMMPEFQVNIVLISNLKKKCTFCLRFFLFSPLFLSFFTFIFIFIPFQNQSSFAFVNNFETSPYFRASNFASPSMANKTPSHHSDFTSLPPAVNLNADTNRSSSQNDLLDGLDNRR